MPSEIIIVVIELMSQKHIYAREYQVYCYNNTIMKNIIEKNHKFINKADLGIY